MLLTIRRSGIEGKFYTVIKYMYSKTTLSVKLREGVTKLYETNRGIKQGDSLNPFIVCQYLCASCMQLPSLLCLTNHSISNTASDAFMAWKGNS